MIIDLYVYKTDGVAENFFQTYFKPNVEIII